MPDGVMQGELLTVKEAAKVMAVTPRVVYQLIQERRLPARRITQANIRIHPEDLRAFLEQAKTTERTATK